MRHAYRSSVALAALGGCFFVTAPAGAQSPPTVEQMQSEIASGREREAALRARLDLLEARLQAVEGAVGAQRLSDEEQARLSGRGAGTTLVATRFGDQVAALQAPVPVPDPDAPVPTVEATGESPSAAEEDRKTAAPSEAVETVAENEQGLFGQRLSFEAGVSYSHFDEAQLNLSGFLALDAIFLGLISLDEITADVVAFDATARYGLTDRLQVDVNLPYLYRHSNFQSGGAGGDATGLAEADKHDSGIGDLNFGASYRVKRETATSPDIVVSGRFKIPTGRHPFGIELVEIPNTQGNLNIPERLSTGSGVYGLSGTVSVLKTLDPLVVFGSATAFYNFRRNFDDLDEAEGDQPGWAKLGDALQIGAGVAFALNERSSLSMSFTNRFVERTRFRREGQPSFRLVGSQANVGLLNLGGTFVLTDRLTLLTTVGVGMTDDAPDMVLSVRVPFRF